MLFSALADQSVPSAAMPPFHALPAPPVRLSPTLRKAIDIRVRKGVSIVEACRQAGLSEAGWHKAMKRPGVREVHDATVQRFLGDVDQLRLLARARALETAMDLMLNATSETIRARMAEFLVGDSKGAPAPSVSVHVDARQGGGYEYRRPEQRLVDLVADTAG